MSAKLWVVIVILLLTALALIFNCTGMDRVIYVHLIFTTVRALKSLVFIGFLAVGVIIGVLIK